LSAPPRVSVVVPCFNDGGFLAEALDSVAAQIVQDLEVIVVDDGSTDAATRATLAALDRPRTRVIGTRDNRGLAAARNLGLAEARGAYLCALGADDRLAPRYLEATLSRLEADPSLTWVSTWLQTFGDESWVWRPERCDVAALLAECTVHGAALVRLDAVRAAGGYDERMREGNEEWDLWLRLAERGHCGVILPEALFYYRRRPGSLSAITLAPENHLRLVRTLLEQHHDAVLGHLDEILTLKDVEGETHLAAIDNMQGHLAHLLQPFLDATRTERDALRDKLAEAERRRAAVDETAALRAALAAARGEVDALRRSLSWRITAPLRAAFDVLRSAGRR